VRCQCVGANDPDSSDAVTSDDADQASVAVLSRHVDRKLASQRLPALGTASCNAAYRRRADFNSMMTADQVPLLVRGMLDMGGKPPRSWRKQMPAEDVRYWRKSRKHLLAASISHFDPKASRVGVAAVGNRVDRFA